MSVLAIAAAAGLTLHCVGTEKAGLLSEERPTSFDLVVREDEVLGIGGPFEGVSQSEYSPAREKGLLILATFDAFPAAQLQLTLHESRKVDWTVIERRGLNGEMTLEAQGSAECEASDSTKVATQ